MNENVKRVLENLGVTNIIHRGLMESNIYLTDEMLNHAGFGFEMIKESLPSKVILAKKVNTFLLKMREKQEFKSLEQSFALFGQISMDNDGKVIIFLSEYAEDTDSNNSITSTTIGDELLSKINAFLNNDEKSNKVLLLGHTHPFRIDIESNLPENKKKIIDSMYNLSENPLKLRESGLNISVNDVKLLVDAQEEATRNNFVLQGIALPNGEFNVLFYDGSSIQSLDEIYVFDGNEMTSIPTFRNDIFPQKK